MSNSWKSVVIGCSYTCVIKEDGCIDSYKGTYLEMVGNSIHGAGNI